MPVGFMLFIALIPIIGVLVATLVFLEILVEEKEYKFDWNNLWRKVLFIKEEEEI